MPAPADDDIHPDGLVHARLLPSGTVVQVLPDGTERPFEGRTDWARVHAMTEEEIEANALSDPDNRPMTPEQFANGWRADTPRRIRAGLGLTQERFAERFGIPLGTLRDWEQFASYPDHAARTLLRVIERHPDAVADAVAAHKQHVADLLAQLREPAPTAR